MSAKAMSRAAAAVLLFIISPGAPSCSAQAQAATPDFQVAGVAYEEKGKVLFAPFQPLGWERLAHRDMKDYDLDHPTPAQFEALKKESDRQQNEGSGGTAEVHFSSRLEPSSRDGFYFVVGAGGIDSLQLVRLEGTMRFWLNKARTAITRKEFYGNVVGKPATGLKGETLFVLRSDASISFLSIPSGHFTARKEGKQDVYEYEAAGTKSTLSVEDQGLFDLVGATSYRVGDNEYLLVHWKPDVENNYGGCETRFSIFLAGKELKLIANSLSGCDV